MSRTTSRARPSAAEATPGPDTGSARSPDADLARFIRIEAVGAIPLLAAAVVAMFLANSGWRGAYESMWAHGLSLGIAGRALDLSVRELVDQGLMALFFLVVGLELKRQLLVGELRERSTRRVALAAAVGGSALVAVVFLALNRQFPEYRGWAIPVATDLALVLGAVSLLGARLSARLRAFIVGVALLDNVIAIAVVCIGFSYGVDAAWLLASIGVFAVLLALNRLGVNRLAPYLLVALVLWACVLKSGVQATVTGLLVAAAIPLASRGSPSAEATRAESPARRLQSALHPAVAFVVVPLFVLSAAGVRVTGDGLTYYMASRPVALGVALGLLVAKPLGALAGGLIATRVSRSRAVWGIPAAQLLGASLLGGLGFTVSLLVANLAYAQGSKYLNGAKIAVIAASAIAGLLGVAVLALASRTRAADAGGDTPDGAAGEVSRSAPEGYSTVP